MSEYQALLPRFCVTQLCGSSLFSLLPGVKLKGVKLEPTASEITIVEDLMISGYLKQGHMLVCWMLLWPTVYLQVLLVRLC